MKSCVSSPELKKSPGQRVYLSCTLMCPDTMQGASCVHYLATAASVCSWVVHDAVCDNAAEPEVASAPELGDGVDGGFGARDPPILRREPIAAGRLAARHHGRRARLDRACQPSLEACTADGCPPRAVPSTAPVKTACWCSRATCRHRKVSHTVTPSSVASALLHRVSRWARSSDLLKCGFRSAWTNSAHNSQRSVEPYESCTSSSAWQDSGVGAAVGSARGSVAISDDAGGEVGDQQGAADTSRAIINPNAANGSQRMQRPSRRFVLIEYVMLRGVNDTPDDAERSALHYTLF